MSEVTISNVQSEILLVGSLFKHPDLYIEHGRYIVSKYDLSDDVTSFLYNNFETYYTTFSQTISEDKFNTYISQNKESLKLYRKFGGYKLIKQWMDLSDTEDFKSYFDTVKKYSLLREYNAKGFDVKKIMEHKRFNTMKAEDIVRLIRSATDKISTVIMADTSSVVVTKDNKRNIRGWLMKPSMGAEIPFPLLNEMFRGFMVGKLICLGFLSNEGKTRLACYIASYLAFVEGKKVAVFANETEEDDFRACLLTGLLSMDCFRQLHGVNIDKVEREIVLGQYVDSNGEVISRYCNEEGEFIEPEEDFEQRVYDNSEQYRQVIQVAEWVDEQIENKIFFKFMKTYSDKDIDIEIRKHKMTHGVEYFFYDTLKNFKTSDWGELKMTTTMLSSIAIELKIGIWSSFQLVDDTVYTDVFSLSSNNIANAKQLKHVVDHLIIGKRLNKDEYHKYKYIPNSDEWGDPIPLDLSLSKVYYAFKVDKNRRGSKDKIPLLEVDLDRNTWIEVGNIIKAGK